MFMRLSGRWTYRTPFQNPIHMMKAACSVDSNTCCLRDNIVRVAVKWFNKIMDFLQFTPDFSQLTQESVQRKIGESKRRKTSQNTVSHDYSTPLKQRSQANARERDRTHRYSFFIVNNKL